MADWPYNTTTWQRLRAAHLARSPLCIGCMGMGRYVPANTVDHVTPISDGGAPFPGHDGLASYCPACHSAKTARGSEAGAIRTSKPRRGCNPDGSPLDAAHPWHTARRGTVERESGVEGGADTFQPRKRAESGLKSLRAGGSGPTSGLKTQLVSERKRNG